MPPFRQTTYNKIDCTAKYKILSTDTTNFCIQNHILILYAMLNYIF